MSTHVIILAQGSQSRLPNLPVAKQMLPLPACGNTPILYRTLRQVWLELDRANRDQARGDRITVVAWFPVIEYLQRRRVVISPDLSFYPSIDTLADPGNSSLKGISRFLEKHGKSGVPPWDRTVVLLGDVIYSWACLKALFVDRSGYQSTIGFAGTSDISPSGGEIWGLTWCWRDDFAMTTALGQALKKHPPFQEYQPGQMRKWMWAIHPTFEASWRYQAIDDYTMDVDLPAHLELVAGASVAAAADDAEHGVTW